MSGLRKSHWAWVVAGLALTCFIGLSDRQAGAMGAFANRGMGRGDPAWSPAFRAANAGKHIAGRHTGQPQQANTSGAPRKINVGLYVINLEQLDVRTGNYTVEFYLNFKCEGICDDVQFRILNGKYTVLDKDEELSGRTGWLVYQIRADLNENLDLRDYPFDTQYLRIRIESDHKTSDEEIYVADPTLSDLDPDLALASWVVERNFRTDVVDYHYSVYDQAYSRYIFTIPIYRPPLYGWLKALLPATVILISGMLAYLFNYDSAGSSIAVVTAALAGSVLFNINLTSSLPVSGHLTAADRFMIVNYIALVVTLAVMIVVYVLKERGRDERAKHIFHVARRVVPPAWVIVQAAMLLFILVERG